MKAIISTIGTFQDNIIQADGQYYSPHVKKYSLISGSYIQIESHPTTENTTMKVASNQGGYSAFVALETKDDEAAGGNTKTSRIYYGGHDHAVSSSYRAGFTAGTSAKGFVVDALVNRGSDGTADSYPGFFIGERNISAGSGEDNFLWYHGRPGATAFKLKVGHHLLW